VPSTLAPIDDICTPSENESLRFLICLPQRWRPHDPQFSYFPVPQLLPWLLRFLPDGPAHELEDLLAHLGADNIKVGFSRWLLAVRPFLWQGIAPHWRTCWRTWASTTSRWASFESFRLPFLSLYLDPSCRK